MNSTEEEQPRERCYCDGVDELGLGRDSRCPPIVVAISIYRGPGPLPKYRVGREPTTASEFEGGQLVQAILTKDGLRLPKALVVTPPWALR